MRFNRAVVGVALCGCLLGCAASAPSKNEGLFQSKQARLAFEQAPDLFAAAQRSWDVAADREAQDDPAAARDYRTRSRLLLAAAVAESERISLHRELTSVLREEARWTAQLHEARAVSFSDAQAKRRDGSRRPTEQRIDELRLISAKIDSGKATRDDRNRFANALLDRAALLLSVAIAIGADPAEIEALRGKLSSLSKRRYKDPESVEILLWDVYRAIGAARAQRVEPPPGTADALVTAAAEFSMEASRGASGTDVWTGAAHRYRRANARVIRRMGMLVDAFPHGPVSCRVSGVHPRAWKRLYDDFQPLEETHGGRVTLTPIFAAANAGSRGSEERVEQELRCTFTGYNTP